MIQGDDQLARDRLSAGQPGFVWRSLVADTETPVSAALKLFEDGRGDYLLESVEGGAVRGRYSLMGLAPDLVFRAKGHEAEVNRHWLTDQTAFTPLPGDALAEMKALVEACRGDLPADLPRVVACLVGYFAYETIGLVEKLPRPSPNPLDLPDMLFVRPTLVLVFDRLADRLYLVAPLWPEGADPARQVAGAVDRIEAAAARLAQPLAAQTTRPALGEGQGFDKLSPNGSEMNPTPVLAPGRYAEMVAKAKAYIEAGDIFQVVLAQRFTMDFPLPPFDLYRALRRINPSPFLYHLDMPGFALTGSSPEILVRARDGEVTIRPIAGT
ncbi:MAG TPA: chorismate-binding protein, partial [Chakrabartia sp.]|nr:chorismate-binding protein [Chakrabartia sp.]